MDNSNNVLYLYQTRMNEVVIYYDNEPHEKKYSSTNESKLFNFQSVKTYSGDMTKHSRRRMKRTIECLYMITKRKRVYNKAIDRYTWFKLSHLTLTLSAVQANRSDQEINKQILQPFLRDCKRKLGMNNYVWKAEKQKNGNIHYHIISDLFAEITLIRKFWNNHQNTFNFIDQFEKKHKHREPNSIDIHYVKNDKSLVRYLMKYLGKNQKLDDKIKGKVWDCSRLLKKFKYYSTDLSTKEHAEFEKALSNLDHRRFDSDYFTIFNFDNSNYIYKLPKCLIHQRNTQYTDIQKISSSDGIEPNINF